jgi:hypothetical protein
MKRILSGESGALFFVLAISAPAADLPCPGAFRIDPAYIRVAEETGGQVLMLDRSEAGKSMAMVQLSLGGPRETIFRIGGKLSGRLQEFVIPVDPSLGTLTLSVFSQCLESARIFRPTGREVIAGQPQVDDHLFRAGRLVTITGPGTGDWRLNITGAGIFSAVVEGKSGISLQHVRLIGQTIRANLFGPVAGAEFKIISTAGATLQSIAMTRADPDDTGSEFIGALVRPAEPFRLAVEGRDANGAKFQRVHAPLFPYNAQ